MLLLCDRMGNHPSTGSVCPVLAFFMPWGRYEFCSSLSCPVLSVSAFMGHDT